MCRSGTRLETFSCVFLEAGIHSSLLANGGVRHSRSREQGVEEAIKESTAQFAVVRRSCQSQRLRVFARRGRGYASGGQAECSANGARSP